MNKTILFTGGHHNSALEVAKALKKQKFNVVWVGHKHAHSSKSLSPEYQEVTSENIPFYNLETSKVYMTRDPLKYFKVASAITRARKILKETRPDLVFSFGGYLSVPVVIAAKTMLIPTVTHEQTTTRGLANRFIAPFVKKIFVSHQDSLDHYPPRKAIYTGLPLRAGLLNQKPTKRKLPTIYITCGKQGSHVVNQNIFQLIPVLTKKYLIIHQVGTTGEFDDLAAAKKIKASLTSKQQPNYQYAPYYSGTQAIKNLVTADIIIGRAGAHTTYEIIALNKRAIMIPISWVSHDEQNKNAQLAKRYAQVIILDENQLTAKKVDDAIKQLFKAKTKKAKTKIILDATERIISEIKQLL